MNCLKLVKARIVFFILISIYLFFYHSSIYAQVRHINANTLAVTSNSSAFFDASSIPSWNNSSNIGKGMIFPRVALSQFTSFSFSGSLGVSSNYPTYYDGFIVYNTDSAGVAGIGSTAGFLKNGFWYYDNKSNTLSGGTWRRFSDNLGNHSAEMNLSMNHNGILSTNYIRFQFDSGSSEGYIGNNNDNMNYVAESGANHVFSGGNIIAQSIPEVTSSAYAMVTETDGTVRKQTWESVKNWIVSQVPSSADNLGNHTATQTLQMQNNSVSNAYDVLANNAITAGSSNGKATLKSAGSGNAGYMEIFKNGTTRIGYIGYGTDMNYVAENGARHNFSVSGNLTTPVVEIYGDDGKTGGTLKLSNNNSYYSPNLIIDHSYSSSNGTDMSFRTGGIEQGRITTAGQNGNLYINGTYQLNLGRTAISSDQVTSSAYAMVTEADGVVRKQTWESLTNLIVSQVPSSADNLGNHTATQNLNINNLSIENTARHLFNNGGIMSAKNSAGVEETVFWPRWSDNATYLNYGTGGFNIRNNASAVSMFMSNAGNVGIGTGSPEFKLHVSDRMKMDGANAGTWIEAGDTDWFLGREGTNLRFWNGDNRFNITTNGDMWNSGNHTIGNVPNVGGSTYAMVTETDGTVRKQTWESVKNWIVSQVPSSADNLGNHTAITELQMNSRGIENANYIRFKYDAGSSEGYIGYNNGNMSYVAENGSNHYFTGGNVAINTEPSTTALHIKQAYYTTAPELTIENNVSVKRSFKVNQYGALVFRDNSDNVTHRFDTNGDAYKIGSGTSWNILSDERIKENVKDFKDGLDVLLKIRPVTYKYISAKYGDVDKLNIGVLAQEIEKVAPYTVQKVPDDQKFVEDDFKDLRTYNPESLVYVLINSIKEQQLMINELKMQVSDLLKKKE